MLKKNALLFCFFIPGYLFANSCYYLEQRNYTFYDNLTKPNVTLMIGKGSQTIEINGQKDQVRTVCGESHIAVYWGCDGKDCLGSAFHGQIHGALLQFKNGEYLQIKDITGNVNNQPLPFINLGSRPVN